MIRLKKVCCFILTAIISVLPVSLSAQFKINGELIQRTEFRNGYGKLIPKDTTPSAFIGMRARLQFEYKTNRFTLYSSIQDVRTFGATQSKNDPFLAAYEAWGQIKLDSNLYLKIGRQELVYDNARFLGNVDWGFQGRTHDFALIKYEKDKFKIDVGAGFNQDAEKLYNNVYSGNQYKTAQLFRLQYSLQKLDMALLFWNDGRQFIVNDSTGAIADQGIHYMQTFGVPALNYKINTTTFSVFYYHQLGKDAKGKNTNAFDASAQISQIIKLNEEKKQQIILTLGGEVLSGTSTSNTWNKSFSPLYGTNHAHNGYMDYFYAGGRHERSVGLVDGFLRIKHDVNAKLFLLLNGHYFSSHAKVVDENKQKLDSYLGTELDFAVGYRIAQHLSVQGGYSQFFTSSTFKTIKNSTSPQDVQNWAYILLIFRPNGNKQFIGLLY